ncbi:hypothetical protein SAMD00019534_066900 [Acytostelium subglobosum LB1]|uniref:hypothetical protein n=1 Tax=Acytostelium subglobosum LB1 TaxID=1410327 RepID=UPI00064522AD|nr:hypothetical protein SAMD00019534_066900 [Acytostelium subglobosum LB1]GAM23515.1 hypothetical protein SAMD00019534_066900 [Acytostelium subglobosum LB1]|eukprot:XP_012753256.1 hypothetical protein SAMD00019534_066900 [Acytostelium subglobosum LB1]
MNTIANKLITRSLTSTPLFNRCFTQTLQYSKRFYELDAGDLKRGILIEHKGKLLETTKVEHQKVAMRGGFILADFRNAIDGTKMSVKFRSAETLEGVELERLYYTFAEKTKEGLVFKESDDEEAEPLVVKDTKQLGIYSHYIEYLPKDSQYSFLNYNDKVLDFKGPTEVVMKVQSISDLSNSNVLHFANGRNVKAPSHITSGIDVLVRLPEEVFVNRA